MMVPERHWYPVLLSTDVGKAPVQVRRFGRRLVLWRTRDRELVCMEDRCPHRGTSLALGRVEGDCIRCPMHAFSFDAAGRCVKAPVLGPGSRPPRELRARRYAVREAHGFVWFWRGAEADASGELPEIPWFDAADQGYRFSATYGRDVPLSFLRVMESNFDSYHFDTVHGYPAAVKRLVRPIKSLKRLVCVGSIADVCHVKVTGDLIHIHSEFKDEEDAPDEPGFTIDTTVRFPCTMMVTVPNYKLRGVFVASPIDDRSTWFAGRYYQGFCNVPILGKALIELFNRAYVWGHIYRQDLRLQSSQLPEHSGRMTDQLVAKADAGLAAYWRMFEQAQREPVRQAASAEVAGPELHRAGRGAEVPPAGGATRGHRSRRDAQRHG